MNGFEALHFLRPLWLAALPLAVLLPWWWRRSRRPAGDWARVCDPHLLNWLSVQQGGEDSHRALRHGGPWLAGLALAIATVALAGPSWQKLPDASWSARDARVVALDLSRSMLAEDLRPNRLTRARFRVADLLEATEEGQVGLVSYAGDAFVVSPLTNDMNTIANLLPALQPDIIPVAGSRADRALALAAELLERSGFARGEILLVTDSVDSRDAARARELRDRGIHTSVLAVGTAEGAPIPSGGGFVNDRAGNVVIARLNRPALREVAEAGGGRYVELGAGGSTGALWLDQDGSEFARRDDALGERWKDAGPWLVLALLPLALVAFRRGLFFALPLLLAGGLALPGEASAGWWEDLWLTEDQQAWRALAEEDPTRAAALAQDPALSGEAWYRSGEYANAQDAFAREPTADAHYNRGNALAHLGQYDAALAAYDEALTLQPGMEDAVHNRALVEQLKKEQERREQEQQQGEQGQSSEDQAGEGEPTDDPQGDPSEQSDQQEGQQGEQDEAAEPQEGQQEGAEQQPGEPGAELEEAWTEEDAQAMEQWLRRIPDDPGGLLRRKFRNEHVRRGAPEDENEGW
ncbi:MAG: VWA domain-containing protein [Xanthomonadales bacterium]|nr:VWA domain-containing protein [Xanthomonadales bacterium]